MIYRVEFRPAALKDMQSLSRDVAQRVVEKLDLLKNDLSGDVKRLKNFVPRFRMRVGDWRVLFEVQGDIIHIWRVCHRRDVYD